MPQRHNVRTYTFFLVDVFNIYLLFFLHVALITNGNSGMAIASQVSTELPRTEPGADMLMHYVKICLFTCFMNEYFLVIFTMILYLSTAIQGAFNNYRYTLSTRKIHYYYFQKIKYTMPRNGSLLLVVDASF